MNWLELNNESQLDEIATLSHKHPVAIFKHSTRCPVSRFAKSDFEKEWNQPEHEIPVYLLDLLSYRSVSNAVAEKFGVVHQSPQLIVLQNGKVTYAQSHEQINAQEAAQSVTTSI